MPPDIRISRPIPTRQLHDVRDFRIGADCAYLFASDDFRSQHVAALRMRCPEAAFFEVDVQGRSEFEFVGPNGRERSTLRAPKKLEAFWRWHVADRRCYIDITALRHSVWAPLVKSALEYGVRLSAVYVEPLSYKPNALDDPSGDIFDLTTKFEGLAPLPGFVTFEDAPEEEQWFVPLLGFEGRRFSLIREDVAPLANQVIPVVGVPGYRPEFVGFAYHANQQPLMDGDVWEGVRFATANCPFGLYYLLEELAQEKEGAFFKIAPIGTRPHALGAVLFALDHPDQVELLYDHPVTDSERTKGHARLLVYDISMFKELTGLASADTA